MTGVNYHTGAFRLLLHGISNCFPNRLCEKDNPHNQQNKHACCRKALLTVPFHMPSAVLYSILIYVGSEVFMRGSLPLQINPDQIPGARRFKAQSPGCHTAQLVVLHDGKLDVKRL